MAVVAQENVHQIIDSYEQGVYIRGERIEYWTANKKPELLPLLPSGIAQKWQEANLAQDISAIDQEGNLWLLLFPELIGYNKARQNWQIFLLPQPVREGYTPGDFLSLESWKGNLWIAKSDFLWCFHLDQQWWEQFSYPSSLAADILKKGPKNALWMGGRGYFDGERWHLLPPFPDIIYFWKRTPQCFTWDALEQPWLATGEGIYFYDSSQAAWRIAPGKKFPRAYSITCFHKEIFCSDYGDGLYRFIGTQWKKIQLSQSRPSLSYIWALYPTQHRLWFSNYFGVGSFDGKKWSSHFDSTDYEKINHLFNMTLLFVILLLSVGIVTFLLIGGIKRQTSIYYKNFNFYKTFESP